MPQRPAADAAGHLHRKAFERTQDGRIGLPVFDRDVAFVPRPCMPAEAKEFLQPPILLYPPPPDAGAPPRGARGGGGGEMGIDPPDPPASPPPAPLRGGTAAGRPRRA